MLPFEKRILPFSAVQFCAFFTDGFFKLIAAAILLAGSGAMKTPGHDSLMFFMLSVVYVIPFVMFFTPAGYLSDHFPKRYVIIVSRMLEIPVLLFASASVSHYDHWGYVPIVISFFFFSILTVFFSAAMYSNLPEMFSEQELSSANGRVGFSGFWGAATGMIFAAVFISVFPGSRTCGIPLLLIVSMLGLLASFRIPTVVSAIQKNRSLGYSGKQAFSVGIRQFMQTPAILLAAIGKNCFMALGAVLELILVLFARYELKTGIGEMEIAILQLTPVLGLSIGCLLAGRLSKKKIELGIVPIGTAGVAIGLTLTALSRDEALNMMFTVPVVGSLMINLHVWILLYLFFTGLSGGLVVIPLRSYLQMRFRPEARGAGLALNNTFCFLLMLIFTSIVFSLYLGTLPSADLEQSALAASDMVQGGALRRIMICLGLFTTFLTLAAMWILPDFALRFLAISLGSTIYKVKITGAFNVPEHGPALLLANHVSYIDEILISTCTSRHIRFLMDEKTYSNPVMMAVAHLTRFILVPAGARHKQVMKMFENVKDSLRKGEIVCIFPEGETTKNGIMGRFKESFHHMLPEEMDVPVVPVYIGKVWGSMFSHFYGKIRPRMPRKKSFSASVTFGDPIPRNTCGADVRRRITELAAETAMEIAPNEITLQETLLHHARSAPFRVQCRDFDGTAYTGLGLAREAALLSREIRRFVPPDKKYVGILLPNSCAASIAILAVLFADKTPVPLNPTTSKEAFDSALKTAELSCILSARSYIEKLHFEKMPGMLFMEDVRSRIPVWKRTLFTAAFFLIPASELINMLSPVSKNLSINAALLFSSGSTGIPKGILLSQHNLNTNAREAALLMDINEPDNIIGNLPLFHSFGFNVCFWLPLLTGTEVSYLPNPLDGDGIGQMIEHWNATHLFATPSFLQTYLRKMKSSQIASLRFVGTGAEKLRAEISQKMSAVSGGRLKVTELYGCTELSPFVSINLPANRKDVGHRIGKENSIGVAMPDISCRVVDPITNEPVPPDSEGILFVKGPNVMTGYMNAPEQTRKAIRNGFYNTGDVVRMDENGYISICGRLSRFSKIAGEMVPHEMVERTINEMFRSDSRMVAVGSIPDPRKGEALLVLYRKDMPLTPEQVVDQMRELSISNLWIPKAVNFVPVDELPLLGSGKLDLSLLRKKAEQIAKERAL